MVPQRRMCLCLYIMCLTDTVCSDSSIAFSINKYYELPTSGVVCIKYIDDIMCDIHFSALNVKYCTTKFGCFTYFSQGSQQCTCQFGILYYPFGIVTQYLYTVGNKYRTFRLHNGNTRICHYDLLEMASTSHKCYDVHATHKCSAMSVKFQYSQLKVHNEM